MDSFEYETVWNGGEGLTTYGAQRLGAVVPDIVGGCVNDWIEVAEWQRAHPASRGPRSRNLYRHANGTTGGSITSRIAGYDVATTTDALYRWLEEYDARRWSRLVRFAWWVTWPTCELCGRVQDRRRDFAPGLGSRAHRTPYHRAVCQSCYVRYRMARGRWKGAAIIRRWVRDRFGVQTPEERKRRAQVRYARRTAQRRAARLAQRSA